MLMPLPPRNFLRSFMADALKILRAQTTANRVALVKGAKFVSYVIDQVLETGPWRRIHLSPAWEDLQDLCTKWPLRGADLWHLAVAKRIQQELPELSLFTFDERLKSAANGEGL